MRLLARYVIYGEPASKKNSKNISFRNGRPIPLNSKSYCRWENSARPQVERQRDLQGVPPIGRRIWLKMTFFKARDNIADLSNLYEGPQDLLQDLGVIKNDAQIKSHDGSRLYYLCPDCDKREKYARDCKSGKKGEYKPSCGNKADCPYNRMEIEIYEFNERRKPEEMYVSKDILLVQTEEDIQESLEPPDENFIF